ncbi:MAG TPA: DUF885 domain-containing protein [Myxococcaceae bacterium]|nr:DUF885 domain-containing protein [Myxococcaceae bacterium]
MNLLPLLSLTLAANPTLPDLSKRYLDGLFQSRPHLATFMGVHTHDGELVDDSEKAVQKRLGELATLDKDLAAVDRSKLTPDEAADAQILFDGIALERLYLKEIREWTWDPRLYDSFPFYDPREMIASRLSDIVHGTFADEAQRRTSVKQQLLAVPRLLAQAQKSLVNPSRVHLDQAVKDNAGRIGFFEGELKEFTQKDAKVEAARVAAVKALQVYQKFLVSFPREKATHDWQLGAELYAKKFPLALQTDLTPDQLVERATQAFQSTRAELYAVARPFLKMAPPANADLKAQATAIRSAQAMLVEDHPKPDALVQAHADALAKLRELISQKGLLGLPPAETLSVLPMPEYKRGAAGAEYLSPGMLDTSSTWKGTFYVDPVDPKWPAEKVDSYLRANNNYEVDLTAAHEAYPGHHTQAWYARRSLSALRSTLWSGSFAEGWAVYGERLMVAVGLGGPKNAGYRFMDLKGKMIVASNALLDVKLQTGKMTDEEALKLMEEEGFQEPAQAERKLLRAKLDSTQLCQYFIGYSEILDLERNVKKKGGFDQRAFDEALIGHGTIGVKWVRGFLLK